MMIPYKKFGDSVALYLGEKQITFNQLFERLAQISLEDKKIHFLRASRDLDFIIKFLKILESNQRMIVLGEDDFENNKKKYEEILNENEIHDKCKLILTTSGSSGESKLVQLSKKNIEANTKAVIECLDFERIDSQALILNLSYSFGLLGQLIPALYLGKKTHILKSIFDIKKCIQDYSVSMISGVPSHHFALLNFLEDQDAKKLTHIVSAGAPLKVSLSNQMIEKYENALIYNNYGQTELSPRALCINSSHFLFSEGAAGFPVNGLEAKLTEDGELCFKGNQVMLGYISGNLNKIKNKWLHTGDIAEIKDNCFFIKGRMDDLIKISGERVSIKEIEDYYSFISQIVSQFKIIHKSDDFYGVKLHLFYVGEIEEKELRDFCKDRNIGKFKLSSIRKISSMPLNKNGKIDKNKLKNL